MAKSPVVKSAKRVTRTFKQQVTTLSATVGATWTAFVVNGIAGGALMQYGVIPRTLTGLRGILFAPFLHANMQHLIANTIPFLAMGWLVMLRDARHFLPVTLFAMLGSGLMAWLLGAPGSVHIGASGVVFGYFGFLLLGGWYARSFMSITLSILVAVLWGGLVLGIAPGQVGISWQSHLGGFIAGVLAARRYRGAR
ncbi:rhomboid family intramembrane serine protease [Gemmatimonas groenlandica]|uniref:Rhomboid family intramembrane serine protease n=1 Tax=Gemmatimonas groenlandica TaxID=2732249 RepID=A0A6M4IXQ4_9BACT|nr:rhomboid family intramembrane serine protease [Gemmatimonas groenlandica]QJR36981.1 rhomboid family intramembrane serine protease [Gemmatimonas groenlandica]